MTRMLVAALLFFSAAAPAFADQEPDAEGCKDSPFVSRFPGSRLESCEDKEFGSPTLVPPLIAGET